MEEQKATLPPTDPRVDELSQRVEELVQRMKAKAAAETQLAEEIEQDESDVERPLE